MKLSLAVCLLISSSQSLKLENRDIQWTDMPYGPYFKEFDPNQRAYGRPPDSNFKKPEYKDMAGANTGTLHQSLVQSPPEMDYSTGRYKEPVPTIPTSDMNNFGKG